MDPPIDVLRKAHYVCVPLMHKSNMIMRRHQATLARYDVSYLS